MSKIKTAFHCQECGAKYSKWQGQCNKCGIWNSIIEEIKQSSAENLWDHKKSELNTKQAKPKPCLLYTSPSPRDRQKSRMPSSA